MKPFRAENEKGAIFVRIKDSKTLCDLLNVTLIQLYRNYLPASEYSPSQLVNVDRFFGEHCEYCERLPVEKAGKCGKLCYNLIAEYVYKEDLKSIINDQSTN